MVTLSIEGVTTMTEAGAQMEQLKQRMKSTWMTGDFGQIAKLNEKGGEEFVGRLGLKPGMRILDVACGTGNQSIPAARTGAQVTGLDIATNLLEQAQARAAAENLKIKFIEGDAEALPFEDGEFDAVITMFGAMFAPRPEKVAAEFKRVCKPGGLIAMGNWTPEGLVGKMFALGAKYVPPPTGIPAPVLWGSENVVRERFGNGVDLQMKKVNFVFDFNGSPEKLTDFFRQYFGPTQVAFSKLDAEAQGRYKADLVNLWTSHNRGDANHTVTDNEYLEVHGRRR
jgi:2-polyprenyl-3-methyl-5-hydroxy-6-metoxy-1,4-benzoquinol methylase